MPVTGWGTDREILLIFAAAYVCLQEIYYCFFSILYLDKERDIIYNLYDFNYMFIERL